MGDGSAALIHAGDGQVAEAHPDMAVAEVTSMHIGLACFAEAVFPEDALRHIDDVLAACADVSPRRPPPATLHPPAGQFVSTAALFGI